LNIVFCETIDNCVFYPAHILKTLKVMAMTEANEIVNMAMTNNQSLIDWCPLSPRSVSERMINAVKVSYGIHISQRRSPWGGGGGEGGH
jgi:hypothetical protein